MTEAATRQSNHFGRAYRRFGPSNGSWAGLVCHQFAAGRPPPSQATVILPHHGGGGKHFFASHVPQSDRSSHRYYESVSRFLGWLSREGPCDAWWPSEPARSPNSRGRPPPVRFRKTEKLNDRKIRTPPGSKGPSFCRYIFLSFRFRNSSRLDTWRRCNSRKTCPVAQPRSDRRPNSSKLRQTANPR